ncbi:MAG: UDP-N-acetylmuramate-L-alanine ligase [candidate division TM6 bacterium GW2011_GWE2_41_16]|nr:MAG: UDP-N-acetylmuramate-L-alanine ligase [candidate division TM6 bacterium GW2011_GWE2_41_16]
MDSMTSGQHVHFLGIGGIGMSALALVLLKQGCKVTGSDLDVHKNTCALVTAAGGEIWLDSEDTIYTHKKMPDLVVYSTDIGLTSRAMCFFQDRNVFCVHRSDLLAALMREKKGIAVTGSHGKTTTSALLAHLLVAAGLDPLAIIGGIVPSFKSNVWLGEGDYLVAEADESDRSFEKLHSLYGVITNVDREHLNVYTSDEIVAEAFGFFAGNVDVAGMLFLNADDAGIQRLETQGVFYGTPVKFFSTKNSPKAHYLACDARKNSSGWDFAFFDVNKNKKYENLSVSLYGEHMLSDVIAALSVCAHMDIDIDRLREGLASFTSVDRRFTLRKKINGASIIDDYGHHPTEIAATLKTAIAQVAPDKKIHVLFQPHRYTRTQLLWDDFVRVLSDVPENVFLVLTDIFAAFEAEIPGVSSKLLVQDIAQNMGDRCVYVPESEFKLWAKKYVHGQVQEGDMVLFLGAGKIHAIIEEL